MTANKKGKEDSFEVKYDTTKSPAHFTTTEHKPDGKSDTSYGIYKIEGDTLTICMTQEDDSKEEDRPTEFKTTKDGNQILMTLKKK